MVENGQTKRPAPVFGPGIRDEVLEVPGRNPQGRPTFGDGVVDEVLEVPDNVRNPQNRPSFGTNNDPNRRPIALPNFQALPALFQG